jgi:diacylglycerol kinase family enzyme
MGGDGTFAEVAKGIFASQHPADCAMGMLPTGTANDQGKSFGLDSGPGALERNVAVIGRGDGPVRTVRLDRTRDEDDPQGPDVRSFSVGFGRHARDPQPDRERVGRIPGLGAIYRDQMVYAGAVFRRLVETYVVDVKFDLDVVIDGVVHSFENLLDVIVKNTRIFGGEWIFDQSTESDDGRFELVPVIGRRDFGTKLLGTLRGSPVGVQDLASLGFDYAPPISGTTFELTVRTQNAPLPAAQIDGEEVPAGDRYRIDVVPRALRLIVPRDHVDPSHTDRSAATSMTGV